MTCPSCGAELERKPMSNQYYCSACGWSGSAGGTPKPTSKPEPKKKWPWSKTK